MKKYTSWVVVILAIVIIVLGMVWYSSQPGQYDQFATCIKQSGATFLGAFWCPHCQAQKAEFGKSAEKLPYVECSTPDGNGQTQVCIDNKIESYPTWRFKDGTIKTGTLSFEELSTFTGCPISAAAASTTAPGAGGSSSAQ